jgi:hypothetical protein
VNFVRNYFIKSTSGRSFVRRLHRWEAVEADPESGEKPDDGAGAGAARRGHQEKADCPKYVH